MCLYIKMSKDQSVVSAQNVLKVKIGIWGKSNSNCLMHNLNQTYTRLGHSIHKSFSMLLSRNTLLYRVQIELFAIT